MRTAPDQALCSLCSMRLGVGFARTEGMRTMFAKSKSLLREAFARVVMRTAPDQRLFVVYCSMRLGVGFARTIRDDYIHSGGKEFRNTNEAIMEVHAARLMAQLENSCLAGGITSRTQRKNSTDSWLRWSWLARKLLFHWTVRNRETIRQRCQAGMPSWYGQTAPTKNDSLE
ncbi:hypothetical protein CRE_22533 [Caenorhabditis remanei]|uniref:Uncharacterized protein n=1 Tax=Caenorhabditis remanei TaxID=31234 RepID=E3MU05_CAERE|nr:hypothetical protein CRE_22533 [Caenorhabditis remanei]